MKRLLIHNAFIVNEGQTTQGSVVIEGDSIKEVLTHDKPLSEPCDEIIDASGCYLLPGVIDEHVHFREPGYTQKAEISTESMAAAAGGVTSVMDMPNTTPFTTTIEHLQSKLELFSQKCVTNYSCFFGATNSNYKYFNQLDPHRVCGIKLFMGSSTGNMLVDQSNSLKHIFGGTDLLVMAHCEDQKIITANVKKYKALYGDRIPVARHMVIRSIEACWRSSKTAVELARHFGTRLHIAHLSTAKELQLLTDTPLTEKKITAEVCIGHLYFSQKDYARQGALIKCNPSIKHFKDREALRKALPSNLIDTIATDHAPHLLTDKDGTALTAASGMPSIQFSLVAMLQLVDEGLLPIELVVQKMCHAPALLFHIDRRGFIRKGFKADLVLVRKDSPWEPTRASILSKCGWSPFEHHQFNWKVEKTWINGHLVYSDHRVDANYRGEQLFFN